MMWALYLLEWNGKLNEKQLIEEGQPMQERLAL